MNFYKPINLPEISITPVSVGVGLVLGIFVVICYIRYYVASGGAAGISRSLLRSWVHIILAGTIPFGIFFAAKLFLAASDRYTQGNLFISEMIATLMWAIVIFYLSIKEYLGRKIPKSDKEERPQ